jgi:cytochrome c biogenesis factor
MNLEKITRIGCIALGVVGVIFLAIVFVIGDDSIKMAAASGNYAAITPIIILSQIILLIAIIVTLTFSLQAIAKDKAKMKNALKSAGLFLVVVIIAFFFQVG